MGSEAVWVPIVASLVSAGVNEANNRSTARKRDRDIAEGIRKNSETQKKANAKIGKNLDFIEDSSASEFKDTLQGKFLNQLNRQKAAGLAGLDTEGGTSDAFNRGQDAAKTGSIDYAGNIADLLSGIDAAGLQRNAEGFNSGDLGMDLGVLERNSDQDSFLSQLRASRHRNNPLLSIAAAGISGAGGAYAANKNAGP